MAEYIGKGLRSRSAAHSMIPSCTCTSMLVYPVVYLHMRSTLCKPLQKSVLAQVLPRQPCVLNLSSMLRLLRKSAELDRECHNKLGESKVRYALENNATICEGSFGAVLRLWCELTLACGRTRTQGGSWYPGLSGCYGSSLRKCSQC
jgi:hypothetical protein